MHRGPVLLFCLFAAAATFVHASVALFMEEPYGEFGAVNPTGHAAVYFNHICADSPTSLRPCHDGEYGVVISSPWSFWRPRLPAGSQWLTWWTAA
jgi:hypothetical protein